MNKNRLSNTIHHFEKFNSLLGTVSGLVLLAMNIVVFYAVIMRYAFSMPPQWSTETVNFMLLFITFIPAGLVLLNDGHIKVDFVTVLLSPKARKRLTITCDLMGTAYFLLLFWQTMRLVIIAFKRGWMPEDLEIPLGYPFLILPLGCALLALSGIVKAVRDWSQEKELEGR